MMGGNGESFGATELQKYALQFLNAECYYSLPKYDEFPEEHFRINPAHEQIYSTSHAPDCHTQRASL